MGKSTISMAVFNSFLYVYQRVTSYNHLTSGLHDLDGVAAHWAEVS